MFCPCNEFSTYFVYIFHVFNWNASLVPVVNFSVNVNFPGANSGNVGYFSTICGCRVRVELSHGKKRDDKFGGGSRRDSGGRGRDRDRRGSRGFRDRYFDQTSL